MIPAVAGMSPWATFQEGWHEFFLMTGTAAVTLAGLLFVAISIHVDALIHASREHLLALARAILLSYVMVLTLSLMMLVPGQGIGPVGVGMGAVGVAFLAITSAQLRRARGFHHPDFPAGLFRRRMLPMLIGYAVIGLTGASMVVLRVPELLYFVIGALCMLLGNATGASWDLLVRTARIRRAADAAPAAAPER